jgi:hypothetical protein
VSLCRPVARFTTCMLALSAGCSEPTPESVVVVPRAASHAGDADNAIRGLAYAPTDMAVGWRGTDSIVIAHVESYASGDATATGCAGTGLYVAPFIGGGGTRPIATGEPICRALRSGNFGLALSPDLRSVIYSVAVPTNLSRVVRFRLTDRAVDTLSRSCSPYAEEPALSRDGGMLAIKALCAGRAERHWGIYVRPVASGSWRRVLPDTISAELPAWSPDGRALTLRLGDANDPLISRLLATVDLASGDVRALLPGSYPSWSPDGGWIAYVHRDTASQDDNEIRVVRPDGSGARTIFRNRTRTTYVRGFGPSREGMVRAPLLWTPDSRGIVFGRAFDRGISLWHVRLDSARVRRVTESAQR